MSSMNFNYSYFFCGIFRMCACCFCYPDTASSSVSWQRTTALANDAQRLLLFFIVSFPLKSADAEPLVLLSIVLIIIPVFGLLSITCELGQRLSQKFEKLNDDLWECKWYLYSIKFVVKIWPNRNRNITLHVNPTPLHSVTCKKCTLYFFSIFSILRKHATTPTYILHQT